MLKNYFIIAWRNLTKEKIYSLIKIGGFVLGIAVCLGFLALSSFMAAQRTKEIGIRKVMGASILNITFGLSRNFLALVIIANIIAWPLAYYFMNKWLQNFAYRTDLSWWMFVLSGGIALLIASLMVSWQAIRAATANPIEALRYE